MYNYGPYYGYPFYYRNMNPRFRSNNWNNQSNYHNYYYNNYDDDYSRRSRFNYDNYNQDNYGYNNYDRYNNTQRRRNKYYLGENGIEEKKEYYNDNYNQNYNNSRYNKYYNKYDEYNNNTDYKSKNEESKENKKKSENDLILDYENDIRKEIALTTPLISDELPIYKLNEEYKSNKEYEKSVENISKKYKAYKKVRRDGNCFYRGYIYRLFEETCIKKDKNLYEKIKKKIIESKSITEKNGYEWDVVQDFYDIFLDEYNQCFNSQNPKDYLRRLFSDNNKGNYLIYFIRFCIAAYLKENKDIYKLYIEDDFDTWIRKEVEAIDHEADQIQIMGCVNYFDVGVKIEYLNKFKNEVVKLPESKNDNDFFIYLLFSPGHYDILYI